MSNYTRLKNISFKVTLFILVVSMLSCTTKRKKNEVSKLGKMFHNTTAKYNGYFNANELVDESILELKEKNEDDFRFILPVYDYVNVADVGSVTADLDKAIQKVTTATALHEPSHWVDDCYVLMGKAQYLKQEYETSVETLEYFEEQFDPKNPYGRAYEKGSKNKRKSKKEVKKEKKQKEQARKEKDKQRDKERKEKKKSKEQERKDKQKAREKAKKEGRRPAKKVDTPKTTVPTATTKKLDSTESDKKDKDKKLNSEEKPGGLFKHTPAYYEGLFWLSRAFIERERYSTAEQLLNKIEKSTGATKEIRNSIPAARAHLAIKKKSYADALISLEEAIDLSKDKSDRARYTFIMAQIHEENGNIKEAFDGYDKSIKLSNNYDMAFNAKLNKIKAERKSGKSSKNGSIAKLDKMISDRKNDGYQGEVYFTRAEIQMEDNDVEAALADFRNALEYGSNSQFVRVEAYYKLASIYYEKQNFVQSKLYFDSTLAVMTVDDKRRFEVKTFAENLGDIVRNIEIVETQDSLLRMSKLSKAELRAAAKRILEEGGDDIAEDKNAARGTNPNLITSSKRYGTTGKSNFFAYNQIARSQGYSVFKRTWGQRALEDNWRRSQRNDASEEDEVIALEAKEEKIKEISDAEVSRVMKDVPTNPAAKELANKRIQDALMQLGVLYRDRVQNYEQSIASLVRLTKNYPDYEKMDQALYYLYLSYKDLSKHALANKAKTELISTYPESKFSKLASDPSYANQLMKEGNKLENYYNKTLEAFDAGDYLKVIARSKESAKGFVKGNQYAAKFALLKAMSIGATKGKGLYIKELQELVKAYPNSPEEVRANEILRFLNGDDTAFDEVLYDESSQNFEKDPTALHYGLIVVYELSNRQADKIKINISDYNKLYHKSDGLKTSDIILDRENKSKIILVRGFETEQRAMKYYNSVINKKAEYIKDFKYDFFISTQTNFREVIKQKTINNYRLFFNSNYLEEGSN